MRNFYIFKIKKEVKHITKENPYDLFHTLETIYYHKEDTGASYIFLRQLIEPISIRELDILLFKQ